TMDTIQEIGSNIVNHKFVVDFGGKVNIALNFGLIRYLQELKTLYKEQLKKNHGVFEYPRSPLMSPTIPSSSSDNISANINLQQQQLTPSIITVSSSNKG